MDEIVSQLGKAVFCAVLAGLLFTLVWQLKDSDGNIGITEILADQADTETAAVRMDMEAVKNLLTKEKPEIFCKDAGLSGRGYHAGEVVEFKDFIAATEDTGTAIVDLRFPNQIRVDQILAEDGNPLDGFSKGDQTAVFAHPGHYLLTVTAVWEEGCSTTKDIMMIIKQ